MSKTITTTVTVQTTGDGLNRTDSFQQVNTNGQPPDFNPVGVGSGTFSVLPSGPLGVLVVPPSGSTGGKTLKGILGDTGIPLDPQVPLLLNTTTGFIMIETPLEPTLIIYL